jgi:hypothetical protein
VRPSDAVAAPGPSEPAVDSPTVAILADDVIWATRLWKSVQAAGGLPKGARRVDVLEGLIEAGARLAIVDLTARAYDPVGAVATAIAAGARVLAVGQHDDVELRKQALAAGAERVYAYRKLFEDGPSVLAAWLAAPAPSGSRR